MANNLDKRLSDLESKVQPAGELVKVITVTMGDNNQPVSTSEFMTVDEYLERFGRPPGQGISVTVNWEPDEPE